MNQPGRSLALKFMKSVQEEVANGENARHIVIAVAFIAGYVMANVISKEQTKEERLEKFLKLVKQSCETFDDEATT